MTKPIKDRIQELKNIGALEYVPEQYHEMYTNKTDEFYNTIPEIDNPQQLTRLMFFWLIRRLYNKHGWDTTINTRELTTFINKRILTEYNKFIPDGTDKEEEFTTYLETIYKLKKI